jgi:hypothetical protein
MSSHDSEASGCGDSTAAALFHQARAGCQDSSNVLIARHKGPIQTDVLRQVLGDA